MKYRFLSVLLSIALVSCVGSSDITNDIASSTMQSVATNASDTQVDAVIHHRVLAPNCNNWALGIALGQDGRVYAGDFNGNVWSYGQNHIGWDNIANLESKDVTSVNAVATDATGMNVYVGKNTGVVWRYSLSPGAWQGKWQSLGLASKTGGTVSEVYVSGTGQLYAGTFGGHVFKYINNLDGWSELEPRSNQHLDGTAISVIVADDESNVYALTHKGNIFQYTGASGWRYLWNQNLRRDIASSLAVYNDNIYLGTRRGNVWQVSAINLANESEIAVALDGSNQWVTALTLDDSGNLYAGILNGVVESYSEANGWNILSGRLNQCPQVQGCIENSYVNQLVAESSQNIYALLGNGNVWQYNRNIWGQLTANYWNFLGNTGGIQVAGLATDESDNLYIAGNDESIYPIWIIQNNQPMQLNNYLYNLDANLSQCQEATKFATGLIPGESGSVCATFSCIAPSTEPPSLDMIFNCFSGFAETEFDGGILTNATATGAATIINGTAYAVINNYYDGSWSGQICSIPYGVPGQSWNCSASSSSGDAISGLAVNSAKDIYTLSGDAVSYTLQFNTMIDNGVSILFTNESGISYAMGTNANVWQLAGGNYTLIVSSSLNTQPQFATIDSNNHFYAVDSQHVLWENLNYESTSPWIVLKPIPGESSAINAITTDNLGNVYVGTNSGDVWQWKSNTCPI